MTTVADIGRRSVKIHLFHWPAFLTFQVTTQVILDCEATCGPSVCGIYFNTNHTNLTNCAGVNLQQGNNSIRVSLTRIFRILLIERGNDPTRTMKW